MRRFCGACLLARGGALVACSLLLGGCVYLDLREEPAFPEVQRRVSDHLGQWVHWRQGTPADADIDESVRALLSRRLTPDAAVEVALLNNPALQATYEELGIAQAEAVQAGLFHNPVLAASVGFPAGSPSGTALVFDFAGDLLDLLVIPARQRFAHAELKRSQVRAAWEAVQLAGQVQQAYYELQASVQRGAALSRSIQEAESSYQLARRFERSKRDEEFAIAREQAVLANANLALTRNEMAIVEARERLTRLMGLRGDEAAWSIPEQLEPVPANPVSFRHLERAALEQRLDLALARQEVEVLSLALDSAETFRWIPFAALGVNATRDTAGQWVTGPSLAIQLPLFDWGQARRARLRAALRQAEHRAEALEIAVRSEVREAGERLRIAARRVEDYRAWLIPVHGRAVSLAVQHYDYALIGPLELLSARQAEAVAYSDYTDSMRDYWLARASLERALGVRIPADSAETAEEPPETFSEKGVGAGPPAAPVGGGGGLSAPAPRE